MLFRGKLSTIPTPHQKTKTKNNFTLPHISLENPPFNPDVQSVCTMVAFHHPHKACSNRCHQFSHSVGMATGRFRGLLSIVVNTQSAPLWILWTRIWKKKKKVWLRDLGFKVILYQVYPKTKGKWFADWNLAVDSLTSQYSNKWTPFQINPEPSTEKKAILYLKSNQIFSFSLSLGMKLFSIPGLLQYLHLRAMEPRARLSLCKLLRWRCCFSVQPQVKRA